MSTYGGDEVQVEEIVLKPKINLTFKDSFFSGNDYTKSLLHYSKINDSSAFLLYKNQIYLLDLSVSPIKFDSMNIEVKHTGVQPYIFDIEIINNKVYASNLIVCDIDIASSTLSFDRVLDIKWDDRYVRTGTESISIIDNDLSMFSVSGSFITEDDEFSCNQVFKL